MAHVDALTATPPGVRRAPVRLSGPAFREDPTPAWAALRAAGPVVRVRFPIIGEVWAATTHAACTALVKNNAAFVMEGRHAGKSGVVGLQWWMPGILKVLANGMLLKDEPEHRRLRQLVDHAFARRDILAMRGGMETLADRLLDEADGDIVDLVPLLTRRLPMEAICDLLGLPAADRAQFAAWAQGLVQIRHLGDLARIMGYLNRMAAYLRGLIEANRRTPQPGLIGELVVAEKDGERLASDELLSMVFLLLVAGLETTTHLIGDSVLALDRRPEQKAWLLADPAARMERAVEELARFTSPVQGTKPRYVAQDIDFGGQRLRRGEVIMALLGSANHDPAVFCDPETLRLDRFPNPHLVFSSGVHFCLGMQLARVETQSALARLYARYPDLAVVGADRPEWITRPGVRGLKRLPVRLGRRAL